MANASKADYDAGQIVDVLGAPQGALPSDIDDRLTNLEAHLNKMKGELVRLNLVEFKEKTEEKFNIKTETSVTEEYYSDDELLEKYDDTIVADGKEIKKEIHLEDRKLKRPNLNEIEIIL